MQDREHEEDRECEQDRKHDREPEVRVRFLALSPQLRVPARAMVVVRAVDRFGIDGRFVGNRDAACGLGHAGSLVPLSPGFDHTFHGSG
jgi:hypothetical protein